MNTENTEQVLPTEPKWKIVHKASHVPMNSVSGVEYIVTPADAKIDLYELMEDKAFIEVPITFGDGGYYSGLLNDLEIVGYAVVSQEDIKASKNKEITPLIRRYTEGTLQGFINRAYYPE